MTTTELARWIGHALSNSDDAELLQSVLWHSASKDKPAHVGIDSRDGTQFVVTVNQLK